MTALTFAVLLPVLLVAHNVADHWVQSNAQAAAKGGPGWPGRLACARHVATYTATTALAVGLAWLGFGLPVTPLGFVLDQALSAVTHYWADRRSTLAALARVAGKGEFWALGAPRSIALVDSRTGNGAEIEITDLCTGKQVPFDNPTLGTGAYALDQAFHWLWLLVAAPITAGVR